MISIGSGLDQTINPRNGLLIVGSQFLNEVEERRLLFLRRNTDTDNFFGCLKNEVKDVQKIKNKSIEKMIICLPFTCTFNH